MFYLQQLTNGLMKVYFMRILLKVCSILQLIINNLKSITKKYFKTFKKYPNEITILAYDALGLVYYAWKKMEI